MKKLLCLVLVVMLCGCAARNAARVKQANEDAATYQIAADHSKAALSGCVDQYARRHYRTAEPADISVAVVTACASDRDAFLRDSNLLFHARARAHYHQPNDDDPDVDRAARTAMHEKFKNIDQEIQSQTLARVLELRAETK
ncbi:hypothetical protein [Burkholderia sp. Ac-20365]|uniref:hypothetical protein n=1 Tax=Burkholderia sp. Ac-20365 TaxID=2703897 RepID=UPI00197B2BF6|nr:hypothetical protein [Burkholderia sp. Ac-20365]MBN3761181.1 hypothetical protein [Burkholderia sp. Ac-20365]